MSFFQIPGNIKQQFVPFVLQPGAAINTPKNSSPDLKGATPQLFTFRDDRPNPGSGIGYLNICPQSFKDYMAEDVSWKLIYPLNAKTGKIEPVKMNYQSILNCIPGIQIREFLPDARLDQCLNFFSDMMDTMKGMFTKDKDNIKSTQKEQPGTKKDDNSTESFFLKLTKAANWSLNYLTGSLESESLIQDLQTTLDRNSVVGAYSKTDPNLRNYVINFPYILYYRFQSCVTTNIYEVPCQVDGNQMYHSDGAPGWNGGGFEIVNRLLSNLGPIGRVLNSVLGNVRVNYLDFWDSRSGHEVPEPKIVIKFDLFNDTAESALYNFIFVNTLIPNARWIQYNVFQHSSSLYDIKLEGYNRLFACKGTFNVTYKGVLRDPSESLLSDIMQKCNSCIDRETFKKNAINSKLIKIPDVYSVEMEFSSCLPANFNTWLFMYSENKNQFEQYTGNAYQESAAVKMLSDGIKKFTGRLSDHWDSNYWPEQANVDYSSEDQQNKKKDYEKKQSARKEKENTVQQAAKNKNTPQIIPAKNENQRLFT